MSLMDQLDQEMQQTNEPSLMDQLDQEMNNSEQPSLMDQLDQEMSKSEQPSLMNQLDQEMRQPEKQELVKKVDQELEQRKQEKRSDELSPKTKKALSQEETGLSPSGYVSDVFQYVVEKYTGEKAPEPRKVKDIYDAKTGKLAAGSLNDLLQSKMSAENKKQVLPEVMEKQFGVPREAIEQARLVGPASENPIARSIYYIDALATGEWGQRGAAYLANKVLAGRQVDMPKDFTTPEQDAQILQGGKVNINGLEVKVPENPKSLEEAKKEMWKNYVSQVRDLYTQGTQQGVLSDVGMAAQLLFGVGESRIGAMAAKAGVEAAMPVARAGLAVANPISAVAAKVAPQAMSKFVPRMGVALAESAAMVPVKEADPLNLEERSIGAAMGGTMHLGGEALGKLSDVITGYHAKENPNTKLSGKYLTEVMNISTKPDVRQKLDEAQQMMTGTSIRQNMDIEALNRTAESIKGDKASHDKLKNIIETPEMQAAAGKPDEIIGILDREGMTHVVNAYRETRSVMSEDYAYRNALLDNASLILGDEAHPYIEQIRRMSDVTHTQDKANSILQKTTSTHGEYAQSITGKLAKLAKEIDDPRISFLQQSIDKSASNFEKIDTKYSIAELKRVEQEVNAATPGYMQEVINTGIPSLIKDIEGYNANIDKHQSAVRGVVTVIAKNAFIKNAKDAFNKNAISGVGKTYSKGGMKYSTEKFTKPEFQLVQKMAVNPTQALNEHMQTFMLNKNIPTETKAAVQDLLDKTASAITNNQRINIDFEPLVTATKGARGAPTLRDVREAAAHYNREYDALANIKNIITADDVDVLSTITAFRKASDKIITEPNLQRMQDNYAQMVVIWTDQLNNSSLDLKSSTELLQYLLGDVENKIKLDLDPNTPISSSTHAANMLENSKILSRELLDLVRTHYKEAIGEDLDVNHFMAAIYNPKNVSDLAKFDSELLDIIEIKKFRKGVEKDLNRGRKWYAGIRNVELLDFQATAATGIRCAGEIENISTASRKAGRRAKEMLDKDGFLDNMLARVKDDWGTPQFQETVDALYGRKGILDVGEFFYKADARGEFSFTDSGEIFSKIFLDEESRVQFVDALTSGHLDVAERMVKSHIPEDAEGAISELEFPKHFVRYFNRDGMHKATSENWNSALEFVKISVKKEAENHADVDRLRMELNNEYRESGISKRPMMWKETRARNRRETNNDISEMHEIFKTEDISSYFGSSNKGQLEKADKLDSGEIMHPVDSLVQHVIGSNTEMMMFHPHAILNEHGILLTKLGHTSYAHDLLSAATVDGTEAGRIRKWQDDFARFTRSTPLLKELTPWFNMFYRLFATPANAALSAPSSLMRTLGSQHIQNFAYSKGHLRSTPQQAVNMVKGLSSKYFPHPDKMSPDMHKIVMQEMSGYKDITDRAALIRFRETIRDIKDNTRPNINRQTAEAAEYGIQRMSELVTANLKERVESSLSKNTLAYGGVLYDTLIKLVQKEGRNAAFEMAKPFFKNKTDVHIWDAVTRIEQGIKAGDPYRSASSFLKMYHTNNIGRFGIYSTPPLVRSLFSFAPQVVRFFSSRTNNLTRLACGFLSHYEKATKLMGNAVSRMAGKEGYEGLPDTVSKQLTYSMIFGLGVSYAANVYRSGLQGDLNSDDLLDSARPYVPDYALDRAYYGTGWDFRDYALFSAGDWEWMSKLAQGDIKGGGAGLLDSLLLTSRTRGASNLFIVAEAVTAAKEFQDLNEKSFGWAPLLGLYDSRKNKAELEYSNAKAKYEEDGSETNYNEMIKAQDSIDNLNNYTGMEVMTGVMDSLLGMFPATSWLLHAMNPTTISSLLIDTQHNDYMEMASRDLAVSEKDPFAGSYQTLLKQLGMPASYNDDAIIRDWYLNFAKAGILPEDAARILIDFTTNIHNTLRTSDNWLNWLRYQKLVPDKKAAIEKSNIVNKYGSEKYKQLEINPEEERPVIEKDYGTKVYERFQRKPPK